MTQRNTTTINISLKDICNTTSIRHDIVHRNGINKDGDELIIDKALTLKALKTVEQFATKVRDLLDDEEKDHLS